MQKTKTAYIRNPVYIFFALGSLLLFLLVTLIASRPTLGLLERAIFEIFYHLPGFLTPIAIAFVILGALVTPLLLSGYLALRHRLDISIRILSASLLAFGLAQLLSIWIGRPDPSEFLNVTIRASLPTASFPSTYAAVSIATGLMLAVYLPRAYRRWTNLAFLLVGCCLMFLGLSLPLGVIAGWLVGIFSYSFISLALGSRYSPVDSTKLARKLIEGGLPSVKLKPASVDARGSVPFFGEYNGGKIFVKVFNQDNNAADWLFKMIRRMQYRRLEDEVPSLTPKRAIEHEAYLTMLATHFAKVRVPEFLGVYKVGRNSYAMAMKRLNAEGLDNIARSKITDELLDAAWKQIKKLHTSRIIHKDLRTANVMIEKNTGLPWLIDFGFSEAAINKRSFYKDNVEFIASSATKIGSKRAVAAALRALGKEELGEALPYMQYAALSGATTTALKNSAGLLEEIRHEMYTQAGPVKNITPTVKLRRV